MKREAMIRLDRLREQGKCHSLQFVQLGLEDAMKDFIDPIREGIPRGAVIGFSKEKMKAVFLSALHPAMKWREIGKLCGTSEGLLRLWNTKPDFKAKRAEVQPALTATLLDITQRILENRIDGDFRVKTPRPMTRVELLVWLVGVLSFLNIDIVKPIFSWAYSEVAKNPAQGGEVAIFLEELFEARALAGSRDMRDWQRVKIVFIKGLIGMVLNLPKGAERDKMRKFIDDQLDELIV